MLIDVDEINEDIPDFYDDSEQYQLSTRERIYDNILKMYPFGHIDENVINGAVNYVFSNRFNEEVLLQTVDTIAAIYRVSPEIMLLNLMSDFTDQEH